MLKRSCAMGCLVLAIIFMVQLAKAADLTVGVRSEPSIDPHFLYTSPNLAYSAHIYGGLVVCDADLRPIPDLATSWRTVDDTTWEFKLRKGVKFHDGSEFTAEDVVFSYNRVPNVPNNPASYATRLQSVLETKAIDPYTVIIKTDKANPVLPAQLAGVIVISKKAGEGATTADFTSGKAAIGTGRYKFSKYIPGDRLILVRNENYWGEKPPWDRIIFRIISNDAARVAALLGGDVDMIDYVPPTEVPNLKKNKNFSVFSRSSNRVIYMVCDGIRDKSPYVTDKDGNPLDKNPLKDVRIRRAISKAIDRDAICSKVMDGLAAPASQFVTKGLFGYNPDIKLEKYDPEDSKKLLAEAGYPHGFGLTVHGPSDRYVNDAKVCQAVAQMLARVGLKMKVETLPGSIWLPKLTPPNRAFSFWMIGIGHGTGESGAGMYLQLYTWDKNRGTGIHNGGYSNPEFDQAVDEAAQIIDTAKREKKLQRAMAIAMADQAIIPLHEQFTIVATKKGLVYTPQANENLLAYFAKPER